MKRPKDRFVARSMRGFLSLAFLSIVPASADTVTSVATGAYTTGTTWSNSTAPAAGNDYVIASGHTVTHSSQSSDTLAGDSLTVQLGGNFTRTLTNINRNSLTAPALILDGGTLDFRSSNQFDRNFDHNSPINVNAASTINVGGNRTAPVLTAYLNSDLTGAGNLHLTSGLRRNFTTQTATARFRVTTESNNYSGNWNLSSNNAAPLTLFADAANALGTGKVTLGADSTLNAFASDGLNSIAGVTLNTSTSKLILTNSWANSAATLVVDAGTVDLVESESSIDAMTITGNPVVAGTYAADQLTALGYGGTFLGSTGTITITGSLPSPTMIVAQSFSFTNNGSTASYMIPINNAAGDGSTALTLSSVVVTGTDAEDVSNIVYPASIAAGASANITFDFTPTLGEGPYTFDLEIASNDAFGTSPRIIPVTVDVQISAGGYSGFVTDAGLDPATTGAPGLDADGDGVANGIEWVVGGSLNDPANSDTGKLPTGSRVLADPDGDLNTAAYLLFTYRRSAAARDDEDTTIIAKYGSDLAGWTTATDGVNGVVIIATVDGFESGIDRVEVYIPTSLAVDDRLFGRLEVTLGGL